jgi:TolA-binding protein
VRSTDCLSDLSARARRYRLSPAEQVRLDKHLSVCASCRREQQIGADFDAITGLKPGDDKRIAELTNRTVERFNKRAQLRRRPRSLSIAAALACALVSAGAGASVVWHMQKQTRPVVRPESHTPERQATPERPLHAVPPTETADVPLASPTAVLVPPHPKAFWPVHPAVSQSAPPPAETASEAASSLFANANLERRQAHSAAAIALYDELQRRHPGSEEAHVSHVSLGRLLLEGGACSDALSQFDRYLTASPDGLLAPEALFGKAQALHALGRRDDERTTWTRLLTQFADSVYATQARRGLEELR